MCKKFFLLLLLVSIQILFAQSKPENSRLVVESAPESGLDIFINGKLQNKQTPNTFQLKSGVYYVYARSKFYGTKIAKVHLKKNANRTIKLHTEALFGTLSVSARPEARVTYDYNPLPTLENFRLLPQKITLRASCPGYAPIKKEVRIEKQKHLRVKLINDQQLTNVKLIISPDTAAFTLSDEKRKFFYGTGPKEIRNVPEGVYRLLVESEGYRTYNEKLAIPGGKETVLDVPLIPLTDAYWAEKANYQKKRNIAFAGAAVLFTTGSYFYIENQKLHNQYVNTHSSREAADFRKSLQKRVSINNRIFQAASMFSAFAVYYQVRYVRVHPKDYVAVRFDPGAGKVALEVRF
ncbi:MAG: PEGA domain-containing protein [Calditrichaeota bacterium]|nr:MAG: PEGA domain-containing protein [Calditrichota bacterium]